MSKSVVTCEFVESGVGFGEVRVGMGEGESFLEKCLLGGGKGFAGEVDNVVLLFLFLCLSCVLVFCKSGFLSSESSGSAFSQWKVGCRGSGLPVFRKCGGAAVALRWRRGRPEIVWCCAVVGFV